MANAAELNDTANKSQLLIILQNMFEEIAAGVGYEKFSSMFPSKSKDIEVYKHFVDSIIVRNSETVDYTVISKFFEDKHKEIVKLSEESSKNRIAWRPTGKVDTTSIKVETLSLQKQHILQKIAQVTNETNRLKAIITTERLALRKQIESTKLI